MTQMTLMKNSREQQDCKSLLCLYITRLCYQVHRKARSGPGSGGGAGQVCQGGNYILSHRVEV
jgi:hypothetical protein